MQLGLGIFLRRHGAPAGSGATALTAATLTRTSGVSTYPPTVDFTRPVDWQNGDKAVMQWSTDPTFATFTETTTPVVLAGGTPTYNFGLSAIVSGTYYMRLGAWSGARPGALNWSNIVGVGDAVAPTITSGNTTSGYQFVAGTFPLTTNKLSTWAIVGGADQAQFSISGTTLSWLAQALAGSLVVQVQPTSVFGIAGSIQTITNTIAANTPTAFVFTDVTTQARSTLVTSNTITVAGLVGGASVPVTITGGNYIKTPIATGIPGAPTSATGTAVNGDQFSEQQTTSASYSTATNATLTIGATSDTYTATTLADPAAAPVATWTAKVPTVNYGYASSIYTSSALAIGAADAARVVVVGITWFDGGGSGVTSVTIGGVSATRIGSNNVNQSMWRAVVPTGTTAVIVASGSNNAAYVGMEVYAVTGSPNPVHTATQTVAYGFNATYSLSVVTPTNGCSIIIAAIETVSGTPSFTNATIDSSGNDQTLVWSHMAAHVATPGTATVTLNNFNGQSGGMMSVSFGP